MLKKILHLFIVINLFCLVNNLFAKETCSSFNNGSSYSLCNQSNLILENDNLLLDNQKINKLQYIDEHDKWAYLGVSSGLAVGFMLVTVSALYFLPEHFTGWNKTNIRGDLKEIGAHWKRNVKKGPVIDKDNIFFNYVTHPYVGAIYYMQTRNAGFTPMESFAYSAFLSTFFWEYGIEAFAEVPSTQDLIITPVVGSLIGELFYQGSNAIKANDNELFGSKIVGYTALGIMDPVGIIIENTGLHKYVEKKDGKYQTSTSFGVSQDRISIAFNINLK